MYNIKGWTYDRKSEGFVGGAAFWLIVCLLWGLRVSLENPYN